MDGRPTGRTSGRAWLGVVMAVVVTLVVSACSYILPSRPFGPVYVVNRDGHWFIGDRCSARLGEAGVFTDSPVRTPGATVDFTKAIWHAVADRPGVAEFELFAPSQPGVTVVGDDGARPRSTDVFPYVVDTSGRLAGIVLGMTLDLIPWGEVNSEAGISSWEDFMKRPNRDFGC